MKVSEGSLTTIPTLEQALVLMMLIYTENELSEPFNSKVDFFMVKLYLMVASRCLMLVLVCSIPVLYANS